MFQSINKPVSCKGNRILVAIDCSLASEWAAQVGRQLAEQLSARVRLVHVVEPALPIHEDWALAHEIETRRAQYGLGLLTRTRLSFPPRLETETILRTGLAFEEIALEAKEWNATLVVLGIHGGNPLLQCVFGSTAEGVLRRSPCPVLVVGREPRRISTRARAETHVDAGYAAASAAPV